MSGRVSYDWVRAVKKAESQIVRLLRTKGPSTGFEIKNGTGLSLTECRIIQSGQQGKEEDLARGGVFGFGQDLSYGAGVSQRGQRRAQAFWIVHVWLLHAECGACCPCFVGLPYFPAPRDRDSS